MFNTLSPLKSRAHPILTLSKAFCSQILCNVRVNNKTFGGKNHAKNYVSSSFFLALPNTLWAADPIISSWKTNIEKSTASDGERKIKEEITTYREIEGGLIELAALTVY